MIEKKTIADDEIQLFLRKLKQLKKSEGLKSRDFAIVLTIAARMLCDEEGIEIELRTQEESKEKLN